MATISGVSWDDDIRSLIEERTGPVHTIQPVTGGFNSEVSLIVHTDSDVYFVKGRAASHPQAWTQAREQAINPAVCRISPRLLWSASDHKWTLLGFEYIDGRHADYTPGSHDIPEVVRTMLTLQEIRRPDIELKQAEQRWSAYTDRPGLFAGNCLLHTDWGPANVLIAGSNSYLVDWAWPTRGAGWIDPACWALWLIASGHHPQAAEKWACHIPSWASAPAIAVGEFVRVQSVLWAEIAADTPDTWIANLADAAQSWFEYRRTKYCPEKLHD